MFLYLRGVAIAFIETLFHGGCNIIDQYLSTKILPRLATLVFFGSVIAFVFTAVALFLFDPPHWLSSEFLWISLLIACIEIGYLFPYYWSLKELDTSIVASLFSIGKIFIPLFAFFVLGERLHVLQYVGFFLIVGSSLILSFDARKLRLNKGFVLMAFVSLILVAEAILFKYAFAAGASWSSMTFVIALFEVLVAGAIFMGSGAVRLYRESIHAVRSTGWMFFLNELFGWAGNVSASFALSILPVTTATAIASTQPLFALGYAVAFKKKYPELFREAIGSGDVFKKIFFFVLTLVGVVLVVAFGSTGV